MLLKQHKNINIYKNKNKRERKKFKAYLFKSWNDTTLKILNHEAAFWKE